MFGSAPYDDICQSEAIAVNIDQEFACVFIPRLDGRTALDRRLGMKFRRMSASPGIQQVHISSHTRVCYSPSLAERVEHIRVFNVEPMLT